MEIKRPSSGLPAISPAENGPEAASPLTATEHTQLSAPAPAADGLVVSCSRAELHSARQPEIVRQSLLALLDRASEKMGALPPYAREQATAFLTSDPYLCSRVLSYLDQKVR